MYKRQGYDDDGYAIYAPDPARLFKPLTTAEFASIAAMSTFRPKAANDNVSFTFDTPALFTLPAGDAGFAGVVEYGKQSYPVSYTHLDVYKRQTPHPPASCCIRANLSCAELR